MAHVGEHPVDVEHRERLAGAERSRVLIRVGHWVHARPSPFRMVSFRVAIDRWQSTGGNLTGGDTLVDRPTGSRSCLNCRRARLAGADVADQALPFGYQLVHAGLDDVADADDG